MYKIIDQMRSVRKIYTETLVRRGDISIEQAEAELDQFNARLQTVLDEVRTVPVPSLDGVPVAEIPRTSTHATGVDRATLLDIARVTMTAPEGFTFTQARASVRPTSSDARRGEVDWHSVRHSLAHWSKVAQRPAHGSGLSSRYLFAPPRRAH